MANLDKATKIQVKNDNFRQRQNSLKRRLNSFQTGESILKLIIGFLLLMLLFRFFNGDMTVPTFSYLLECLQSAPNFASSEIFKTGVIPVPNISVYILGVNIFGWLQFIIELVVPILNFLFFLVTCASNVVVFVLWIIPILFGF